MLHSRLAQVDEDQEAGAVEPELRRVANFRDLDAIGIWDLEFQEPEVRCTCPRNCKRMLKDYAPDYAGLCTFCRDILPGIKSCNCPPGCCDNFEVCTDCRASPAD